MALTIAMVVPPSVNLNTPYAAAPRLAGWLRHLGHTVVPIDVSLELFLRVFSRDGLDRMFAAVDPAALTLDQAVVYRNRDQYLKIIDDAIAVVQLRDLAATTRIVQGGMIPLGPRGQRSVAAPGTWGTTDFARYRVSLMLLELMEFFKATVNPHFGLTDYAASLAASPSSFDPVAAELARPPDAYVTMLEEVAAALVPADLDLVCITCPFPGNLVGAAAQSGGIPAGAAIERGANANGEYVRLADGTQICWHRADAVYASGSTLVAPWIFPAGFSGASRISLQGSIYVSTLSVTPAVDELLGVKFASVSTTSCSVLVRRVFGGTNFTAPDTTQAFVTATGRWF